MRRVALISDIHGNHVAFQAVLEDIRAQDVEAVFCLGDVVGYGPQPVECMKTVLQVCEPERCIMGNHDYAVVTEPIGFTRAARQAALWTRKIAQPRFYHLFGGRRQRWNWLRSLPTAFSEEDNLFVHASPRQHLEEYILEEHTKGISFTGEDPTKLLEENFSRVEHTCFIGHTHRPGVIADDDLAWHSLPDMDYHWAIDERKTLINIGSVGQPRDGDPRACYVVYDGKDVEWRRVAYDIEKVVNMVHANPDLQDRNGDRLLEGK